MGISFWGFSGALSWLIPLALVIYVATRSRRLKKVQDQLISSLGLKRGRSYFRVNFSSPNFYQKRIKIMPFEAKGILMLTDDGVRIAGAYLNGKKFDRSHPNAKLTVTWVGNVGLGSGNLYWFRIGEGADAMYVSADTGMYALPSREATSDIFKMIADEGLLPSSASTEFALEKNSASLALIIAFFALLIFAGLDGVVLNKNELKNSGWALWGMLSTVLAIFPCYQIAVKNSVPSRESIFLSSLVVVGLMLAYVPGIKRLDQALASDRASVYVYTLSSPATLVPVTSGPPVLHFNTTKEYWGQFADGSKHEFHLIHGPLGLWQLDRSGLNQKMHSFYEKYNKSH